MIRRRLAAACLALAALGAAAPGALAAEVREPMVVSMAPSSTQVQEDAVARAAGAAITRRYTDALTAFATELTPTQATLLARQPGVLGVERDAAITAAGSGAAATPELIPPGIRRAGGLVAGATRSAAGVGVAVVDTGLNPSGAELDVREGVNCVTSGAPPADDNGHGTAIGGVIGARANGAATAGMAPATRLHPVKVLNKTKSGTLSQLLCGLDWVKANAARLGIRVVNLSIAAAGADDGACGSVNGEALHRAVCGLVAAGVVVVAAAGNAGVDLARTVPAAYGEALTVTAMSDTDGLPGAKGAVPACVRGEADDRYAAYSNYAVTAAAQAHTVSAPGTCVVSSGLTGGTATYYGTSLASPHVAAAAALCLNDGGTPGPCAGLTPAQIVTRVRADGLAGALGFKGDPVAPVSGRAYGPLASAAAY